MTVKRTDQPDNAYSRRCSCCCCYHHPNVLERAVKKCLTTLRRRLNVETKMLSVVNAGAAAGMGGMDRLRGGGRGAARELAASRDRQVRLHTMRTDLAINLPPSISLPDGEDHQRNPFSTTAVSRIQLRDAEQESEIYQKCIRPPPNRTVLESESPPTYRSSSAGILASSSSSSGASSDWSSSGSTSMFVRCHSMSSTSSSVVSKTGASASHHHHHHHQTQAGQKTDFIQRTVKMFTGSKKTSSAPQSTTPCVIVPSGTTQPSRYQHQQPQQQQQQHQQRRDLGASPRPPV